MQISQIDSLGTKPIILVICNYYLPGYKAGGGLRTLVNMIERFRDRFDFRIIAMDHDGNNIPYDSVKINEWTEINDTKIFYLSKKNISLPKLRSLIRTVEPDAIYLNSVFSILTIFVLILRKLKQIPSVNIILAPEGELSEGARHFRAFRKKVFTSFSKQTGLYKDLIWKTTAEPEKTEAENFKGSGGTIFIAPNIPSKSLLKNYKQSQKPRKDAGTAKMIFLSRYAPKKNFLWLLENFQGINGKLEIDIYGPIEYGDYWERTQIIMESLPENIKVEYKGLVEYESVPEKLLEYHFFILPTLGENFGHVFIEAMSAGCPLIISDRTPWLNLEEKKAGWDLPLEKASEWNKIINYCIDLDGATYTKLSENTRDFACRWLTDPKIEESTLTVLEAALENRLNKVSKSNCSDALTGKVIV